MSGLREELITASSHGQRIHGMLHLPKEEMGPVPAVLLLHGFTGSSSSDNRGLVQQARHLAANGIAALRFDFRGSGQSEGEFSEMTLAGETDDAVVMLDFLAARDEVEATRLGVLGWSLGGTIAALLLARRPALKAMVLWAPVAHPFELWTRNSTPEQLATRDQLGYVDTGGEAVGSACIAESPSVKPLAALQNATVPLRVVHGTADSTAPLSEGEAYVEAVSGPRELTQIQGADHSFSSIPWRAELYAATTDWFRTHL
jgi:pimeloyl-ACP methyl ester carboxylesterase